MTARRQRGATLGLAAACVLVVIVIGVGFFFLSKIIGGGREVANATDAGALNVAKQAIRRGAVNLTTAADQEEFGALCDQPNKLDLLSYNRIVAKAMIVCKNADDEGSPLAAANAGMIHSQVNMLGNMLKANLAAACANPGGDLANDFHSISQKNNTKMWNGSAVQLSQNITPGYMKVGSSSNVYFSGALKSALGNWAPPGNNATQKSPTGDDYSAGYQEIKAGAQDFCLIPVFPDTRPHLVDHGNFSATAPAGVTTSPTLPNAFRTDARALEAKTGAFGGTLACAIVGSLDRNFAARLPKGFVRVVNGPTSNLVNTPKFPLSTVVNDGSNDIFNQELFHSPGINMDQNSKIFSHNPAGPAAMSQIAAYNATKGTFPYDPLVGNVGGGDPTLWTGKAEDPYNDPASYDLRIGPALNHYATQADLDALGSPNIQNCTYLDYDDVSTTPMHCQTSFDDWQSNYGRAAGTGTNHIDTNAGFTNVEFMKADVLAQRAHGWGCASTNATQPSGLKLWGKDGSGNVLRPPANGSAKPFLGGKINYMAAGSPMDLLNEIGGCASTSTVDKVIDRMRQINPEDGNISQHVKDALASTPLPLGKTFYLYADGSSVYMTENFPGGGGYLAEAKAGSLTPDGQAGTGASNCNTGNYPLSGWVVNTRKGVGGATIGDAGYHEVPFTKYQNTANGNDAAKWTPSSGYNNFLGELKFEQTTTGDTYCKPN